MSHWRQCCRSESLKFSSRGIYGIPALTYKYLYQQHKFIQNFGSNYIRLQLSMNIIMNCQLFRAVKRRRKKNIWIIYWCCAAFDNGLSNLVFREDHAYLLLFKLLYCKYLIMWLLCLDNYTYIRVLCVKSTLPTYFIDCFCFMCVLFVLLI